MYNMPPIALLDSGALHMMDSEHKNMWSTCLDPILPPLTDLQMSPAAHKAFRKKMWWQNTYQNFLSHYWNHYFVPPLFITIITRGYCVHITKPVGGVCVKSLKSVWDIGIFQKATAHFFLNLKYTIIYSNCVGVNIPNHVHCIEF